MHKHACKPGQGRCAGRFVKIALAIGVGLVGIGALVMWLWNGLMPEIFPGLHALSFGQALGLLLLARLLVGGMRGPGGCRGRWHGAPGTRGVGCGAAGGSAELSDTERAQLRELLQRSAPASAAPAPADPPQSAA